MRTMPIYCTGKFTLQCPYCKAILKDIVFDITKFDKDGYLDKTEEKLVIVEQNLKH